MCGVRYSEVQCSAMPRSRKRERCRALGNYLVGVDRSFIHSFARSFVDSRSAALCHFAVGTSIFRRGKAKVRILSLSLSLFSGLSSQA